MWPWNNLPPCLLAVLQSLTSRSPLTLEAMRWYPWMTWQKLSWALRARIYPSSTFLDLKVSEAETPITRWSGSNLAGRHLWSLRWDAEANRFYYVDLWQTGSLRDCTFLQDGLTITYFWIKEQIEKEKAKGLDTETLASSKVVGTSAPVQLGSLRKADGEE